MNDKNLRITSGIPPAGPRWELATAPATIPGMDPRQRALELAREVGFDLAGVAPLAPPPDAARFDAWLDAGRHAGLDYLERNRDRIADPRALDPRGKSLLVVGLAHSRAPVALADGARVARYAAGRDYHNVVGRMLRKLARRLREDAGLRAGRGVVDAGPVLERSHAAAAGVGFPSKATNLLHPRFGPWFFLGELILEDELEPTPTPPAGSCGTCTACLDACPTDAFDAPGVLDARRCISYHTIENRGEVPRELRASFGEWLFGCDVCSEVCPWGHDAPDLAERFGVHDEVAGGSAVRWLELDEGTFAERFVGSPLKRPRRAGLARNAAIVLGNRPTAAGREVLLRALSFDPSPLVRETAGWALARAADAAPSAAAAARARDGLARAATADPDDDVRAAHARSLEGSP